MFDIKENLKQLPDSPGVYIHRDKMGQVIYVGKAISLKNRVRQYFQSSRHMDPKVRSMVSQIAEFEYITTGSEMEALILECNLIKKHRPKYNILLRDDKTYPYIKVTVEETYPRILKTRRMEKDGARYFGPYSDVGAVNQIVDLLNQVYALKKCSAASFPENFKPCLNYHINQCDGICTGGVNAKDYQEKINLAIDFLKGRTKGITQYLQEKMLAASEQLDFEAAAGYRDYIMAAEALSEKQRVVLQFKKDVDLILTAQSRKQSCIVLFYVREGKLSGRDIFDLEVSDGDSTDEMIAAFIKQHYSQETGFPKEILLERPLKEHELLESWLSSLAGHQVKLFSPQKGEKRAILELAKKDVVEMIKTIDQKVEVKRERATAVGEQVHQILLSMGAEQGPYSGDTYRIEAYDISNTNGVDTVGAMVVFEGLKPDKKSYRKFKIRSVSGPDDYASMQEVLIRRFRRALEGDQGFAVYPDLMLIDGGKGHVHAALEVVQELGLDLAVAGLAKDSHHRTRALVYFLNGQPQEIPLKGNPMLFQYLGRIQEEVHRFAIDYHRNVRGKKMLTSALDEIPGIGPAKRNALLGHFGSIEKMKEASKEQLCQVSGITEKLAEKIIQSFH